MADNDVRSRAAEIRNLLAVVIDSIYPRPDMGMLDRRIYKKA
jgi:hypothetical protein